ncbi:uncharacterized protein Pyn_38323 [Prunus yedoensis var. nudiflora]|uniref:Transmembrane protein n=1 Tax=Prunus yedoensis var. nudiflora TaxID=2094558 RepID=A0A314ZPJ7_PRUYE|nr:uncharacterized protein Pyn_38323 [Prunus yedoensis var. nudiflora]
MASTSQRPLLIALLTLSIFAISAIATRPCKTLFISSYSFSLRRPSSSSSSGFVTVVTEISRLRPVRYDDLVIQPHEEDDKRTQAASVFPLIGTTSASSSSYDLNSLRDRSRDILSIVVSLLFGVGCGALTAATMYLAWSVFFSRYDNGSASSFDDDFYDASPKKIGYVKIPEVVADSVPTPPSPVKEAVAV